MHICIPRKGWYAVIKLGTKQDQCDEDLADSYNRIITISFHHCLLTDQYIDIDVNSLRPSDAYMRR